MRAITSGTSEITSNGDGGRRLCLVMGSDSSTKRAPVRKRTFGFGVHAGGFEAHNIA